MEFINKRRMPKLTNENVPVVAEGMGVGRLHMGLLVRKPGVNQKVIFILRFFLREIFPANLGDRDVFSTFMGGGWPRCSWKEQNEGAQT